MVGHRIVSLIVFGVITATVLASGPLVPVDFTTHDSPCRGGTLSNEGSALIQPTSIPQSATLKQSEFGAEVWRLNMPNTEVSATDVQGCVRLTYEINIDTLGITSLSATTVSERSSERLELAIPKTSLSPDRVSEDQYNAEVRLIYHGLENGSDVEQTVFSRNITVEVMA